MGVATQNPELRRRFTGRPEFVETFFEYIAEEVRELLASLGFRTLDEAIGRVERLDRSAAERHWKAAGLDIADILAVPRTADGEIAEVRTRTVGQDHRLDEHFDAGLIAQAADAIRTRTPLVLERTVTNVDRSVGTMLGHRVTVEHGLDALPQDTLRVRLTGSAGQSLGAFLPRGITLSLSGEANDYVGKGLSGGTIAVRPVAVPGYRPEDHVIAGNVIGYGATAGRMFLSGQVGERFLVRNSGATAVVEGIGDHGLEYMTGGTAVVLGPVGRNFAAGMSGGVAYLLDFNPARINVADRAAGRFHLRGLSGEDTHELEALLREHLEQTGSPLVASLIARLERGEDVFGRFTKLVPVDYQSVLALRARFEEDGTDPDGSEAWSSILEMTHG